MYQYSVGVLKKLGILKDNCVFYPTCSMYAIDAIKKYGWISGTLRAVRRISRCHPWQKNHIDPV
jgi:hypothetical protein